MGRTDSAGGRMMFGEQCNEYDDEDIHHSCPHESAWKDMQSANQKAFAELQKGWAEALSRFA